MSSSATRGRKVSKAAMARQVAQVQAAQSAPRLLPPELATLVDGYTSPAYNLGQLQAIRPFLRTTVTASTLTGTESVRKHCTHLAGLAAYALHRGRALDPDTLLTTTFIDEYIRLGMTGDGDSLRAERRRRLLCLARSVNPGPTTPAKLTPIGHRAVKPPYTPTELAVIARVSRTQPTEAKRRDLSAVVALGAGAGLDSIDIRNLYVGHILDQEAAGILVHVQNPRPRTVPVRATMEALLRSAITGRPCHELVIGLKVDRRNTAAQAVENAALYNVPHIEQARLRATWLADLMTDSVPIGILLAAAGLKSARTLADLLPHLEPWLEHKNLPPHIAEALRGGVR